MWSLDDASGRGELTEELMFRSTAVESAMLRSAIDGTRLGVETSWVAYSVAFCLGSLILGAMIFKRWEAGVVKKV